MNIMVKKETKKDRILKMFEEAEWIKDNTQTWKVLTYDMFVKNDLVPFVEYRDNYCDVIYAKRIFQKLGYKVYIGQAFHILKQKIDGTSSNS